MLLLGKAQGEFHTSTLVWLFPSGLIHSPEMVRRAWTSEIVKQNVGRSLDTSSLKSRLKTVCFWDLQLAWIYIVYASRGELFRKENWSVDLHKMLCRCRLLKHRKFIPGCFLLLGCRWQMRPGRVHAISVIGSTMGVLVTRSNSCTPRLMWWNHPVRLTKPLLSSKTSTDGSSPIQDIWLICSQPMDIRE